MGEVRAAGHGVGLEASVDGVLSLFPRRQLELLPVAACLLALDGSPAAANARARALWGRGAPRLLGENGLPPDGGDPVALALAEGRTVCDAEALLERDDGSRLEVLVSAEPLRGPGGMAGVLCCVQDVTALRRAERDRHARRTEAALLASERHLRAVVESTPECIKVVARDGTLLDMNAAGLRMVGAACKEDVAGAPVFDLIAPEHRAEWRERHAQVCDGEAMSWEFDILARGGRRRMETHAVPFRLPDGTQAQLATTRDVTARRAAEERQRLLMREVDHRAKNALAVVQSLVRLTRADDRDGFVAAVEGRVSALARAHALLAAGGWNAVPLDRLAEAMLWSGPARERIAIESGPPVALAPDAVQPLCMALHELFTNALRHGALSRPDGRVALSWTRAADGSLALDWREEGGGPPPEDRHGEGRSSGEDPPGGFGLTLVSAIAVQLGGTVTLDWRPEGLHGALTVEAPQVRHVGGGGAAA